MNYPSIHSLHPPPPPETPSDTLIATDMTDNLQEPKLANKSIRKGYILVITEVEPTHPGVREQTNELVPVSISEPIGTPLSPSPMQTFADYLATQRPIVEPSAWKEYVYQREYHQLTKSVQSCLGQGKSTYEAIMLDDGTERTTREGYHHLVVMEWLRCNQSTFELKQKLLPKDWPNKACRPIEISLAK